MFCLLLISKRQEQQHNEVEGEFPVQVFITLKSLRSNVLLCYFLSNRLLNHITGSSDDATSNRIKCS